MNRGVDSGVTFGSMAGGNIERKHLGAYYTPSSIAEAITEWAVRLPTDRLLEPSLGDGVFVNEIAKRLSHLGAANSRAQIYGTDIDPAVIEKLKATSLIGSVGFEIRQADFLAVESTPPWHLFEAVIGNPPYVRHHRIEKDTIADFRRQQLGLTRSADLWCTFVMHSLGFLRVGGRLAFVLPASFGFANYAQKVRAHLATKFKTTIAIRLAFNAFAGSGADERGVVVICDGYDKGPSHGWADEIAWDVANLRNQLAQTQSVFQQRTTTHSQVLRTSASVSFVGRATP